MKQFEFERKVTEFMEAQNMLHRGDVFLLGVSGGADSVALFRFFCKIKEQYSLQLYVMHVEHGLRGEASMQDADFVRDLCKSYQIPFEMVSVGAQIAAMEDTHQSLEEKARLVRYQAFERALQKLPVGAKLAVAHHANDNVETMLFHLVRGTGLQGLRGMQPVTGAVVRPFLKMSRGDIEAYVNALGQDYRTDVTNTDVTFARNKIRQDILPKLEEVNAQAISHMNETAFLVGEMADYVRGGAERLLQVSEAKDGNLLVEPLKDVPSFIRCQALLLWVGKVLPGAKDVGSAHVKGMERLLFSQVGKSLHLPKGYVVKRDYEVLVLQKESAIAASKNNGADFLEDVEIERQRLEEEAQKLVAGKWEVQLKILYGEKYDEFPRNNYTKWFDYDKIKNNIHIRGRNSKDYLTINAAGGTKKLQDYFVETKIPADERDKLPLLCDGFHVIWVLGHRISEYYKVDETTEKILEVQIFEEKENE